MSETGDDGINWGREAQLQFDQGSIFTDPGYFAPYQKYLTDAVVLDAGCNIGRWCTAFLNAGVRRYNGIDASPTAIKLAKKQYPDYPYFKVLNLLELHQLGKAVFDVIFTHTVLQHIHIENKLKILPQVYECLKPGGTLIIEEKNDIHSITTFTRQGWIDFIEPFGFKCLWQSLEDDPRNGYLFIKE